MIDDVGSDLTDVSVTSLTYRTTVRTEYLLRVTCEQANERADYSLFEISRKGGILSPQKQNQVL
jgi:hypothetical protein